MNVIQKTYCFGLLPPDDGEEYIKEQLEMVRQYYNKLVELDRVVRDRKRQLITELNERHPDVAEAEARLAVLRAQCEEAKERGASKDEQAKLNAEKSRVVAKLKKAKEADAYKEDRALLIGALNRLDDEWLPTTHAVRDEFSERGSAWGHRGAADQAFYQARKYTKKLWTKKGKPNNLCFRRYNDTNQLRVQFIKPISWLQVIEGSHTQAALDMALRPCLNKHGQSRGGENRPRLRLRVASGDRRSPIWASWPIVMHRPVPVQAMVKTITVNKRFVAGNSLWSVCIVVEESAGLREPCGAGKVALDVGWRQMNDGTIRCGYLRGQDGFEMDVRVPAEVLVPRKTCQRVQSVRDKLFDRMLGRVIRWRDNTDKILPDWWVEKTAHIKKWKSPARLAALALRWRQNRFDGDEVMYIDVESWRRKDRHLWSWEANLSNRLLLRRREEWRKLGVQLSRRYNTLVIEDMPITDFKEGEKKEETCKKVRGNLFKAAPGTFREVLRSAFEKRGGKLVKVPPEWTTKTCHLCGDVGEWDSARVLEHTCSGCEQKWDQDLNACLNLLAVDFERSSDELKIEGIEVKDYAVIMPKKRRFKPRTKEQIALQRDRSQRCA